MSVRGVLAVVAVECSKLAAQYKIRIALAVCIAAPFIFAGTMLVQDSLPEDTLFGRSVKESGFALPLVVLGFAALWAFPAIASVVGGDLFSAEDRYGTWTTLLTRSRTRAEIFAGKVLTAFAFSLIAVITLAVGSVAAGALAFGATPLVDLSGLVVPPAQAIARVLLAWASVVLPLLGFTALAVLLSIATRSSVIGIAVPVLIGLTMQLAAMVDGPEVLRRLLITSAFGSWHGLFAQPPFIRPLIHGSIVSSVYLAVCVLFAYRTLRRRDIGR